MGHRGNEKDENKISSKSYFKVVHSMYFLGVYVFNLLYQPNAVLNIPKHVGATSQIYKGLEVSKRPPLWSSGQSFWLQIQRSRVRSPALPDFLSRSGSGTGSTQPREVN